MDVGLALYQVLIYTVLFVGVAVLGAFVGYIVSFLVHEQREEGGEDVPK